MLVAYFSSNILGSQKKTNYVECVLCGCVFYPRNGRVKSLVAWLCKRGGRSELAIFGGAVTLVLVTSRRQPAVGFGCIGIAGELGTNENQFDLHLRTVVKSISH